MYQQMSEDTPNTKLRTQINENLKRVYEDALKEDVPDRFKLLLDQLKQKEAKK